MGWDFQNISISSGTKTNIRVKTTDATVVPPFELLFLFEKSVHNMKDSFEDIVLFNI